MKKYSIRTALLTCLALVMVLGASVGPSLSYFTTYVTAEGGYTIHLENVDTRVEEDYDGGAKHIFITNVGEANCYLRAKIFAGDMIDLVVSGEGWYEAGDGYWYYEHVLQPGERSSELTASVTVKDRRMEQDYNVIVVSECTPVVSEGVGRDWSLPAREG